MTRRRVLLWLGSMCAAAACADRPTMAPEASTSRRVAAVPVVCSVEGPSHVARCNAGAPAFGDSRAAAIADAQVRVRAMTAPTTPAEGIMDAVVGGGGIGVFAFDVMTLSPDTLAVQVSVRNQLDQTLGLTSAGALHPDGVRVYIEGGPTATPTGTATLRNATGTGTLFAAGTPYLDYGSVLEPGDAATRMWRVQLTGGAVGFRIRLLVVAETPVPNPRRLNGDVGTFRDIAAGSDFGSAVVCAVSDSGAVSGGGLWCWGSTPNSSHGRGADSDQFDFISTPTPLPVLVRNVATSGSDQLAASQSLCMLRRDGMAVCTGQGFWVADPVPDTSVLHPIVRPSASGGVLFSTLAQSQSAACGLDAEGRAWCRGLSVNGQLGNAQADGSSWEPVEGSVRFSKLSAGNLFFCGLATDTRVWCWGDNAFGQMGRGVVGGEQLVPRPIAIGTGWTDVSAGGYHACGVRASAAWCWGANAVSQAGRASPSFLPVPTPSPVIGGIQFVAVYAGFGNSCGRTSLGALWCWGSNDSGQLGRVLSVVQDSTPSLIPGAFTWTSATIGAGFACGIAAGGVVRCWGANGAGSLGRGPGGPVFDLNSQPIAASGTFVGVSALYQSTCAWRDSGEVLCWGLNNTGSGASASPPMISATRAHYQPLPVGIRTQLAFRQISVGYTTACGIGASDNLVYCWGKTGAPTGVATTTPTLIPLPGSRLARSVSVGARSQCVTATDNTGWCWGDGTSGQLGNGTTSSVAVPTQVPNTNGWQNIWVGERHACGTDAVTTPRVMRCWGYNFNGQLGDASTTTRTSPVAVASASNTADIMALGRDFTCALDTLSAPPAQGSVRCWGRNSEFQLGERANSRSVPPTQPIATYRFTAIAATKTSVCGRTLGGVGLCWGAVTPGDGSSWSSSAGVLPQQVANGVAVRKIVPVGTGACFIAASGDLQCWGDYPGRPDAGGTSTPVRPAIGRP